MTSPPRPDELAPAPDLPAGHRAKLDAEVTRLRAHAGEWAVLPIMERIRLLEACMLATADVAERWAALVIKVQGLDPRAPSSGEAALVGPYLVLRELRILRDVLGDIARTGSPRFPGRVRRVGRERPQVAVPVFPRNLSDRVLFRGVSAEVWMEPGVTEATLPEATATFYRRPAGGPGGVALVLGAGNVSSIAPLDVLTRLFVQGQVVLLKPHPVLAALTPIVRQALRPFVEPGYVAIADGDAAVGAYLCGHPEVDAIHLTGSDRTHDAIVYGPGAAGAARHDRDEPIVTRPMTSELGNVSPVIVVPGPWSAGDLLHQAENVVTQLTNNAGFNCNAVRVVVTAADWPQRMPFLDAIRRLLGQIPTRAAYYPGAAEQLGTVLDRHPDAETFGEVSDGRPPWAFVSGLDPGRDDEICFSREAFCGLFAEVPLAAGDTADFLARAVAFCNERLSGTLNATLIVDPRTRRQPAAAVALERAVADLRYGTVSVNAWAAVGFALCGTTWGAFPGHSRRAIGSGVGVVHNAFLFDRAQKSVIRAPFRSWPKPPWFATHRTADRLAPHLVRFEQRRSLWDLAAIGWHALRG